MTPANLPTLSSTTNRIIKYVKRGFTIRAHPDVIEQCRAFITVLQRNSRTCENGPFKYLCQGMPLGRRDRIIDYLESGDSRIFTQPTEFDLD